MFMLFVFVDNLELSLVLKSLSTMAVEEIAMIFNCAFEQGEELKTESS